MWHRTVLLLALASAVGSLNAVQAQEHATDRGSLIVGGGAGLSSHSYSNNVAGDRQEWSSTLIYFSPRVQYFVLPGLAVGGTVDLTHMRTPENSSTSAGLGPTISYFFGAPEQALVPYISAQTAWHRALGEDYGQVGYGGAAGMLYMLTRSVGLDGSVFYRIQEVTGGAPSGARHRALGLAVGFSAFAF